MTKHNFSAGPSILPKEVFDGSSNAILQYQQTGLSIIEMSHRSKEVGLIIEEAKSLVIELLNLNNNCIDVRLSVGKGFYIRAFAKDLASKLGTYGHLIELKRTAIGPFDKNNTVSIGDIKFA